MDRGCFSYFFELFWLYRSQNSPLLAVSISYHYSSWRFRIATHIRLSTPFHTAAIWTYHLFPCSNFPTLLTTFNLQGMSLNLDCASHLYPRHSILPLASWSHALPWRVGHSEYNKLQAQPLRVRCASRSECLCTVPPRCHYEERYKWRRLRPQRNC